MSGEPRTAEGIAQRYGEAVVWTLRDLLAFSAMGARLVARGKPAYDSDEALRLAAEAILHKIGEAVPRLPDEFTADYSHVPWRSMKATRNLMAHRHEQVDYQMVWNALANRLPNEMRVVEQLLEDGRGTTP